MKIKIDPNKMGHIEKGVVDFTKPVVIILTAVYILLVGFAITRLVQTIIILIKG